MSLASFPGHAVKFEEKRFFQTNKCSFLIPVCLVILSTCQYSGRGGYNELNVSVAYVSSGDDLCICHAPYSDRSCSDLSEGRFLATSATATSSGNYDYRKRAV